MDRKTPENRILRPILVLAWISCLIAAFTVWLPQPARARHITPPAVPQAIQVDLGKNKPFLEGHAVGTQNYICLPSDSGFKFVLFTPQATLFDAFDPHRQVTTHFFSPNPTPNPAENGKIRATWQHSKDSSTVWGGNAIPSSDPNFVAQDAIPWLLLPVAGVRNGPRRGDNTLTATTFIQRVHTAGGIAPAAGCAGASDLGNKAFVPYTADYFFYGKR